MIHVGDGAIDRIFIQPDLQLIVTGETDINRNAGISLSDALQDNRQNRRHRWHGPDPDAAMQIALHFGNGIAHRVEVGEDHMRPVRNPLTFLGDAIKSLAPAALEERHAEFEFKLLDAI